MVATFRPETATAAASQRARSLVEELSRSCPKFRELWLDHNVGGSGEGIKFIQHPIAGLITFEYSTFAVEGRPNLSMVIFNPATPKDRAGVWALVEGSGAGLRLRDRDRIDRTAARHSRISRRVERRRERESFPDQNSPN